MIYIGNLHKGHENTLKKGIVIRCDRGHSVLANPYKIESEDKRDWACKQYKAYFDDKIKKGDDANFMNELRRIYQVALRNDVVLACWCYPKKCHAETIKAFLEKYLNKNEEYKKSKSTNTPNLYNLKDTEFLALEWLKKKGVDENKRKAIAYNFINNWKAIITAEKMNGREFVELQNKICKSNYSKKYADTFRYKAACVLDQVKSIEKRYFRFYESEGTMALSQFRINKNAGMRYQAYVIIHWKDEITQPAKTKIDYKAMQKNADKLLEEELKSTNMHLYKESREDHSWLEDIQVKREKKREQKRTEQLFKELIDKYKK